jgi:hypothetical protein
VADGLAHALAEVAGFLSPSRSSTASCSPVLAPEGTIGAADRARFEFDFDFDGGVAAGVEDFAAVSPRRYHSYERELWAEVSGEVVEWNDRLADVGTGRKIEGLPERLDALWTTGVSLEGDVILETWEARRAALFRFWDTRTESAWGEAVRDAVQAFILGEVETGEHPFPVEEQERLNAGRLSSRPFPFRPPPQAATTP